MKAFKNRLSDIRNAQSEMTFRRGAGVVELAALEML